MDGIFKTTTLSLLMILCGGINTEVLSAEEGHCIWYDTCGTDTITGKNLNCLYTGPAKPLTDRKAQDIYKSYCPDLYPEKEGEIPKTCCSRKQLSILQANMDIPKQVFSRCPSCLHNFLNLFCYLTCHPEHSLFVHVNSTGKGDNNKTVVKSVDTSVSVEYAYGMFNSCENVQDPIANKTALSLLCGRTADQCTPQNWLHFMGSTDNGQTPFNINFTITDQNIDYNGTIIRPMNATVVPCTEGYPNGSEPCSCLDCVEECVTTPSPYIPAYPCSTHFKYISVASDSPLHVPNFAYEHLIIEHKGKDVKVMHQLPPPSEEVIAFEQVFNKTFLHQVLDLQNEIETMFVSHNSTNVSISDICLRDESVSENCISPGLLQYYQQSHKNIDKKVLDKYGLFVLADYLDHFLSCVRDVSATDDHTALHMSCRSNYNSTVFPDQVLCGYDGINYQNSTALVATYIISNPDYTPSSAAWRNELVEFVKNFSNPIISLSLFEEVPSVEKGHCIWYGVCGTDKTTKKDLNCLYTGPPKPLTDKKALDIYKSYCPDLYYEKEGETPVTCCSARQVFTIEANMGVPKQSFSGCPSCLHNFLNLYCYLTCHPEHSLFVHVNSTGKGFNNRTVVKSVDMSVSDEYGYGMFNSCKNVQDSVANMPALSLLCGRTADQCTPQNWLHYMGSTDNGQTPFNINFTITDQNIDYNGTTLSPMNATVVPCTEGYPNGSDPCSCQDCIARCPPLVPPPPPPKPFTVLHIDGYAFIGAAIFIAFLAFFGVYAICYNIIVQDSLNFDRLDEEDEDGTYIYMLDEHGRKRRRKNSFSSITPDQLGCLEKFGANLEIILENYFNRWGTFCARRPFLVLTVGFCIAVVLSCGTLRFKVITDPVRLWSSPDSQARQERNYFDSHFVPFYRTEQLIIRRTGHHPPVKHDMPPPSEEEKDFNPIFDLEFLHQVLDLQTNISQLEAPFGSGTVTLEDICFKPMSPNNEICTIQSVLQYYQNSHKMLDKKVKDSYGLLVLADYLDHFLFCINAPASLNDTTKLHTPCLGEDGVPAFPWIVLGGFPGDQYGNSTALVITFVVNNHLNEEKNKKAEAWESLFISFMKNFTKDNKNMSIAFSSERSISDELNRESRADIKIILISYFIMFAYISLALGQFHRCDRIMIDSKVTLGLAGVIIVLFSVGCSLGFFSYVGEEATLIIIEVVPFLVLAVGVDNIFILVQAFQRDQRLASEDLEQQIGRIVGHVGPSMLLTSFSESVAFFLGALTDMPAVKVFSLYAAMAVLFDFLLQITCFISLMTLDAKRQENNRYDVCCCNKSPLKEKVEKQEGLLFTLVKKYYSHFIMKEWVRPIVMVTFVGWFAACASMAPKIEIGLDQSLAMPRDSYVLQYFHNLTAYLSVGPPVYFVMEEGHNYTSNEGQNAICSTSGCPDYSLSGQVFRASRQPNYTKIRHIVSSWLDDYFSWLQPGNPPCCRYNNVTGDFCEAIVKNTSCVPCDVHLLSNGRPEEEDFMLYLPWFLKDNPEIKCSKGGHPAYGSAVELLENKTEIGATYFMTYHTILKTSADYIAALRHAREIASNITEANNLTEHGHRVFPYSIFYVFYEQYLTIVQDTIKNLAICIVAIFFVTAILLGFEFYSAMMVVITICFILADMLGMMYLWSIPLNAISLVNLVMTVGISVEFCSHIVRAFTISTLPTRKLRAKESLARIGSSVLSGITLTKLGGIIVLAFSESQLFEVFYFRMYLGIVIFGASHGLIFLPVLLSYIGPPMNKAKVYYAQTEADSERQTEESRGRNTGERIIERRGLVTDMDDGNPPSYESLR